MGQWDRAGGGYGRWAVRKQEQEQDSSSRSGQWLDQIKVHCETAPQRPCAHTEEHLTAATHTYPRAMPNSDHGENGYLHSQMLSS